MLRSRIILGLLLLSQTLSAAVQMQQQNDHTLSPDEQWIDFQLQHLDKEGCFNTLLRRVERAFEYATDSKFLQQQLLSEFLKLKIATELKNFVDLALTDWQEESRIGKVIQAISPTAEKTGKSGIRVFLEHEGRSKLDLYNDRCSCRRERPSQQQGQEGPSHVEQLPTAQVPLRARR
ncbi:MAG: hypothetical protein AAF310_01290 [Myxococcota bacterium]